MEKKILRLLAAGFMLFPLSSDAQTNCDDIKKENEYLKKAMQITNPIKKVTSSKIDFNFLECKGNVREQTVEIVMTIVNHDATREFQFENATALDLEGNEYPYGQISIGGRGVRNTIRTDVPVKTTIVFKKVLPTVKMLKDIPVSYYHGQPGNSIEIEFKDIPINWQ